jgi:hypothetical protein
MAYPAVWPRARRYFDLPPLLLLLLLPLLLLLLLLLLQDAHGARTYPPKPPALQQALRPGQRKPLQLVQKIACLEDMSLVS